MTSLFKYFKRLITREGMAKVGTPSPEEELYLRLKPFERHLYKLQDIIVWKDLQLSITSVIILHLFFFCISSIEWRFLGLFFSVTTALLIRDAWVNHIWPEIRVKESQDPGAHQSSSDDQPLSQPEGVLTLPELSHYATELQNIISYRYRKFKHLRKSQPAMFCIASSLSCLVVAGLGTALSGLSLLYLSSVAVLTLPGVYIHLISPQQKEAILNFLHNLYSIIVPPDSSRNVDDYMPDTSRENLDILAKAGENSADLSTPSSESSMVDLLLPGIDESSVDTVDSLRLEGGLRGVEEDSESEEDPLSFKNSHFNGSSGSSEGEDRKGLTFPDIGQLGREEAPSLSLPSSTALASALTGVFYKTFPSISGKLQFPTTGEAVVPSPTQESDSDSEFEIIDQDS